MILFFMLGMSVGCSPTEPYLIGHFDPAEQERSQQARQAYVRAHPTLDERTRLLILDGVIDVGMSKEQVELLAGRPLHVLRNNLKRAADELWFYRGPQTNDYYYFTGDRLTHAENGGSLSSEGYAEPKR